MPAPKKGSKVGDAKTLMAVEVDVPDAGDTYPAKIVALRVTTAGEVFKDKAKQPDLETLALDFEGPGGVEGTGYLSAPGIGDGGQLVVRNPKSNLYRFVKRYKKGPRVGMPIEVFIDDKGFYRIRLE